MEKEMLYYDCLSEFKSIFYRDALTKDHLVPHKIEIKKMNLPDGESEEHYNFRGWELIKDDVKYLVSDAVGDKAINIKEILPIKPTKILEVGAKGFVYKHIKKPITLKFRSEQSMSFRELVDFLSSFEHDNPIQYKLHWFKGLASVFYRYNDRTATTAGFGKDSIVDIFGNLLGRSGTIESPTIAKLEERAVTLKWLVVNEIINIEPANWRIIEQFLLAAGAHKPEVTKHSRSFQGVGEVLDLKDLSIGLTYNDIEHYPKLDKYFDRLATKAVKDRFVPFAFWGKLREDFNKVNSMNVKRFVEQHMNDYKKLIYNLTFYSQNLEDLKHGYDRSNLVAMPHRWSQNVGKLLNVIDVYCDTQEEFTGWIEEINRSVIDYKAMVLYPEMFNILKQKLMLPQSRSDKIKTVDQLLQYYNRPSEKDKYQFVKHIKESKSFGTKIKLIDDYNGEKKIQDTNTFW